MCRRTADLIDRHHSAILDACMDGATIETLKTGAARLSRSCGLTRDDTAIVRLIRQRLVRRQH
ncbi:MAG: hypothetical protein DMF98_03895 [Acidobacteria bacterium]|nr:MAG: hypothetical protein DMF98_03895 [Acidobacteriota bacterium]